MTFSDFLEQQFLAWQQKAGKRKSLEQFAAYLGVSQPLLSLWMSGRRKPGSENIGLLAELFGPEIYDALALPRPDPDLQTLSRLWPRLPEATRHAIREQAEKYVTQNEQSSPQSQSVEKTA